MAAITTEIPRQNFELLGPIIAAILLDEITNQVDTFTLGDDIGGAVQVLFEKGIPFDVIDYPAVNVVYAGGTYANETVQKTVGTYTFLIQCYAAAKGNNTNNGSYISNRRLQRLLGVCRAILKNPVYKTLGLTPPSLGRLHIDDMVISDPKKTGDAQFSTMGMFKFTVEIPETYQLAASIALADSFTEATLEDTGKGYRWIQESTP